MIITISLFGLVGIQLYWIRNAISVKEANFSRGASEAIAAAIYKYNKIEMARNVIRRQEQNKQVGVIFNVLDSINQRYYSDMMQSAGINQHGIDQTLSGWQSDFQLIVPGSDSLEVVQDSDSLALQKPVQRTEPQGYARRRNPLISPNEVYREFFERTKMINDLFDDLFSSSYMYSPSSQDGKILLDSLLNAELEGQGIKTEYEFGVYDPVFNTLLAERTGLYSRELMEAGYVYSLYPNDVFRDPEFLLVYFPNQKTYVLAQMNIMMALSAVLMLIIIGSFTYTIITIFRQKQLSVMKNDFINNMTHELKTPISTISLACQALRDQDVKKSEDLYQTYINVINEENQRLGMMTEKVLQTAQIDKGKIKLSKTGFNFHDVIEDAINKSSLQLQNRHGKIHINLQAEFSYVEADKVHMTNVVFNLLDNAIKYSPDCPKILVSTENKPNGIIMHVKDNGVGITKANQKKVFDKLYRVSTGNVHNVKGFGLGLSYVKAIVEMHGGHISVQSELKKGSVFSVFLPFGFPHN